MSGREIYVRMELRSHICRDCRRALMGFECACQCGGTIISEPSEEVKINSSGFFLHNESLCQPIKLEPNLLVPLSQIGFWAYNTNL